MNHKNNKRSESTKNKIKSALIDMLKEQELSKITVMALCEKANINRSTFYNHYSSPKSIIKSMEKEFLHMIAVCLNDAAGTMENQNKSLVLSSILTTILEYIRDNLDSCRILCNTCFCPDLPAKLCSNTGILEYLRLSLSEDYSEEKQEYLYPFLLHGAWHVMDLWMQNDCDSSPEEMAKLITCILTRF